jgi:hypothetical protein
MARKRRFRFGLPIVFAGRPSVGGVEAPAFSNTPTAGWCWSSDVMPAKAGI